MKHLKRWNESHYDPDDIKYVGGQSIQEEFLELQDCLQEIFDEFHVSKYEPVGGQHALSNDEEDDYNPPETDRYWEFSYNREGKMKQINICNLSINAVKEIRLALEKNKKHFEDVLGFELEIVGVGDSDGENDDKNYIIITPILGEKLEEAYVP